jgi:hypothetical protein
MRVVFLGFFAFCQVVGVTCGMEDLSLSSELFALSEAGAGCPMDNGLMCPPLLASSPDRHAKSSTSIEFVALPDADLAAAWIGPAPSTWRFPDIFPPFSFPLSERLQVLRI